MKKSNTSRRQFLQSTGLLSIGFSLAGTSCFGTTANTEQNKLLNADEPINQDQINAWLQVLENGQVKVFTGKIELGQGILTAIMQVAAEELNCSIDQVDIQMADTELSPDEGYTAGSMSIERSAMTVRNAAAAARELLLSLAAKKLQLDTKVLELENGIISSGNKKISLHELLEGKQLTEKIGKPTRILGKTDRKLVGKPIPRRDIEEMVRGKAHFVQDLQFPGMLHARVVRPPGYTSKLVSLDQSAIDKLPGIKKLVRKGSFLAVVSDDEYQAIKLAQSVKPFVKWTEPATLPSKQPLNNYLKTLKTASETDKKSAGWNHKKLTEASQMHEANYSKPYIMHAANGPSCAVAIYKENKLTVWSHTQGVYPLRTAIAAMLELPETAVEVKGVAGAGCYGHNGADDVGAEAALIAMAFPDTHIRLQWMRQEENAWEPYSTAMLMELKAGLNKEGKIVAWNYELWSDVHGTRPGGNPVNLLPYHFIDDSNNSKAYSGFRGGAVRNAEPYYTIDEMQLQSHIFDGPLRRSSMRGLGAYGNIFAIESFMDELALLAGKKPIAFRIQHSKDPRAIACLEKIEKMTSQLKFSQNEGIGYAFSRYKNSAAYCAVAVEVMVDRNTGAVQLKKMWAVVDAGETINSDGLKNQIEGGMVQSASWALMEAVTFNETHITSLDWNSYPILRFNNAPLTEVEVIDRVEEAPLGAGEAAQGPATAALVNAIYHSTGIRIRTLPVDKELLKKRN